MDKKGRGYGVGVENLPDFALGFAGPLGTRFFGLGRWNYHSAASYVWRLPYGRNSDRSDYRLVLLEGRGTCSTKHALLAALAAEHDVDVELRLGIYEMDERNTPGVGAVLSRYELDRIPEAHCYLAYAGARVDLTRAEGTGRPDIPFLHKERIEPGQIGEYKLDKHREFVRGWAAENGLNFGLVWRAREECIEALTQSDATENGKG